MCAIAGIVGLPNDSVVRDSMLKTMLRRGPDGNGEYVDYNCTLLHTRLAIIDPENGKQPMNLDWENESYIITYNGELYNTDEIRNILRKEGHIFKTYSDTEVVLHAYAHWREKCLDKLNGIFAFAVWEITRKRLFLARDRIGVKPLFYKIHNGGIIFSSEIKTILKYPTVKSEIDENGVAEILLLGPGRTPGCGVFRGISELTGGHYAFFENGKLSVNNYWSLKHREHTDSFNDTVERVRSLVLDAILSQTVSDVPLGTFLSGGLDSSIISAICAEQMQKKEDCLETFSLDYADNQRFFVPGKFQPETDNGYIEIMKSTIKTKHQWSVLTTEDLIEALEDATRAKDLPGMADVDFSLLIFCKDIKKHVKVALSGECADEIFGGYPWYRDPEIRSREGFPWAQNTKYRAGFLSKDFNNKIDPYSFVQDRYLQTIKQADVLPGTDPEEKRMKEMIYLNHHWFMQTLLDRKDRMSMYHALEVRVPFCDYRIADYLYSVPWKFKDHNGYEKGLLRAAMHGILPEKVLWRKKSPYPKTYHPSYMLSVSEKLKEIIADPNAPIHQIIDKKALKELLNAEYAWPWYGQLMKVPQTIAYMLQINFWLQEYHVSVVC